MSILALKVCRICIINRELVPIVEDNIIRNELTILQKLEALNLNIQENDGFPQNICVDCIKQLNSSFEFIEKSKKSEEFFRNQLLCNVTSPDDTLEQDVKFVLCGNSPAQNFPLQPNVEIFIKTNEEAVCIKQENNKIVDSIEQEHPEPHDHKLNVPPKSKKKPKVQEYLCVTCQKVFPTTTRLNQHILSHLKAGNLAAPPFTNSINTLSAKHECPQCGMCFQKSNFYKLHIENFHITGDNATLKQILFCCAKCGREFPWKNTITRHLKLHMRTNDPNLDTNSLKCSLPSCETRFISGRFLRWHEFRVHNKPSCPVCKKSCSNVDSTIHHIAVMHGTKRNQMRPDCNPEVPLTYKEKQYSCPTCQRVVSGVYYFNRHIQNHLNAGDLVAPPLTNSLNRLSTNHECPQCGMCFQKLYHYNLHNEKFHKTVDNANLKLRNEKNEGLYCCAKCGREFRKIKSLKQHLELHMLKNDPNLDMSSLKCSLPSCEKRFISERMRLWHEFRVHNKSCCPVCNKPYSRVTLIIHHLSKVHGKKRDEMCLEHKLIASPKIKKKRKELKYVCATCQRVCRRTNLFNRHIQNHLNDGDLVAPSLTNSFNKLSAQHECPQCGMCFHQLYSYKLHNENFHKTGDNAKLKQILFCCAKCGREFEKKDSLERHLESHMIKNDPNLGMNSLKCSLPNCEKRFISERVLLWHEFKVHNKLCCPVCNKAYSNVISIVNHLAIVHREKRDQLCPLCGKRFSDNSSLKQHIESHNEERKIYTCTLCTKTYQTQSSLYVHTKSSHENRKPFICDFDGCSAKFFVPSLLKKHKMGHTGEKPFKCDYCPMRFRQIRNRVNHHRTHTGQKPFQCTYDNCDKAFAQSYDLTKHKTIHTGEKRHICHCGEAFRLASFLKTHKKSHQAA